MQRIFLLDYLLHNSKHSPDKGSACKHFNNRVYACPPAGISCPPASSFLSAGCFLLLFANAFGTLATIYALTSGNFPVVPIVLFEQIRGNVLYNPNLGYALAVGMILIMAVLNSLYFVLRRRAERWQK